MLPGGGFIGHRRRSSGEIGATVLLSSDTEKAWFRPSEQILKTETQLNRYMSTMAVPKELRQKLREYFVHYQNASDAFNEGAVLSMLSPGLRSRLCSLSNAPLLRKVSFFKEVDEACVSEMAQLLVANLFVPDEVIINKGHYGEAMCTSLAIEWVYFLKSLLTQHRIVLLRRCDQERTGNCLLRG
jgi:hypothetical protein